MPYKFFLPLTRKQFSLHNNMNKSSPSFNGIATINRYTRIRFRGPCFFLFFSLYKKPTRYFVIMDCGILYVFSYDGALQGTPRISNQRLATLTADHVSAAKEVIAARSPTDGRSIHCCHYRTGKPLYGDKPLTHNGQVTKLELDPCSPTGDQLLAHTDSARDLHLLSLSSGLNRVRSSLKIGMINIIDHISAHVPFTLYDFFSILSSSFFRKNNYILHSFIILTLVFCFCFFLALRFLKIFFSLFLLVFFYISFLTLFFCSPLLCCFFLL